MDLGSTATTNEIALGGFIATLVGLIASIWLLLKQFRAQIEATKAQTKALVLQAMIPYAEKYELILKDLRPDQRMQGFWGLPATLVNDEETMATFLRFCNLCSQEYYLAHDVLERELWSVWQDEMQRVFRSDFGRAAWETIRKKGHFESHSKFEAAVDDWVGLSRPQTN